MVIKCSIKWFFLTTYIERQSRIIHLYSVGWWFYSVGCIFRPHFYEYLAISLDILWSFKWKPLAIELAFYIHICRHLYRNLQNLKPYTIQMHLSESGANRLIPQWIDDVKYGGGKTAWWDKTLMRTAWLVICSEDPMHKTTVRMRKSKARYN